MTSVGAGDATSRNQELRAVAGALEELAIRAMGPLRDNAALQHEIDEMHRSAHAGDADDVDLHSLTLHTMIIDGANNVTLSQMWRRLGDEIAPTPTPPPRSIEQLVALAHTNQQLVESIIAGDTDRACLQAREYQNGLASEAG